MPARAEKGRASGLFGCGMLWFAAQGTNPRAGPLCGCRPAPRRPVKLIDILQGKWLGHPLHPAIVHIPLGGWVAACGIDVSVLAGWTHGGPPRLALYCVVVGLIGVALAVPPGLADWAGIKREKPAWRLALYHLLVNVAATLVWVLNAVLRLRSADPLSGAILTTSILGTLLVLTGGYLGSLLVFDHGVSIARQSKSKWRRIAQRGGARLPEES